MRDNLTITMAGEIMIIYLDCFNAIGNPVAVEIPQKLLLVIPYLPGYGAFCRLENRLTRHTRIGNAVIESSFGSLE